jgi:two-component system sensor histidine kinase AtoS
VAVNELVRETILALPIPADVTVQWLFAPNLPPVPADARQIEQAVGNLGMNALQAMPEGGRLTVRTHQKAGRVEIAIEDTGPGVPTELQDRVFEPFFSTKVTGTGLGLPLVHEIATAHGGHSSLQSIPGEGACFTLSLPVRPAGSGAAPTSASPSLWPAP